VIHRESTPAPCGLLSKLDLVWIEPGFTLGSRPYAYQRKAVSQLGIRVVVALHETNERESEAWQAHGVRLIPIPTPDWVEIPIVGFDRVVGVVYACLDASTPVLLHCLAGINRAPTVAAAVLCHRQKMNVDVALGAVKRVRVAAKPTPDQELSLRSWYNLRCR
jgi:protein-tyrosine phosphatase